MKNPFRYFNNSPEIIRLTAMMYIRCPLSLRQVVDLLFERGIDICHETVRFLEDPVRSDVRYGSWADTAALLFNVCSQGRCGYYPRQSGRRRRVFRFRLLAGNEHCGQRIAGLASSSAMRCLTLMNSCLARPGTNLPLAG